MSRLANLAPTKQAISSALELGGLGAIAAGVWGMAGMWWGLVAAGVAAVIYAFALDR